MHYQSIAEISTLLQTKKASALELAQSTLTTIKQDKSNAVLHCCDELALTQAKQVDAQLATGKASKLTGIPVIYKDNFNVRGYQTTCASKILENHTSVYDATVVTLMQNAGTLSIGKANMDEFAMGSTNENSAFGAVSNPFNSSRCTGGSSGGSAAVVSAGLVPVAFGSDTGGSVRQPAAFCGVTGLKPTYGRLSRFGIVAFASSFDQPGIFTRSALDSASVLSTVAHHDDKDSTSVDQATGDYLSNLNKPLSGKKIGLVKDLFERISDPQMAQSYQQAIAQYQQLGVEFIDVELPNPELCVAAYYVLSSSECSSNLSRFDGVRYGHRTDNPADLEALYVQSRSEGFGAETKRRILLGTFALSAGYFDAYYVKAQKMRRAILNHFIALYQNVDAIILPTSLSTAPEIGGDFDYNDDMCTITANLAGLPAISHPIAQASGLPVGLQIIGKHFDEAFILNMTHQYQQHSEHHLLRPNYS